MADYDEFDALLEEPFGEDVDWAAIEGMEPPPAVAGAVHTAAGARSDSEDYFGEDDGLDEAFLDEVRLIEEQAMTDLGAGTSLVNGGTAVRQASSNATLLRPRPRRHDSRDPLNNVSSAVAGPSRPRHAPTGRLNLSPLPDNAINPPGPSRTRWAQTNNNVTSFLDSLPHKTTKIACETHSKSLKQTDDDPVTPTTPHKRRRLSSYLTEQVSPTKKGKSQAKEAKLKVLETFGSVLECPICYEIMAASHTLSCGHAACGICLSKWLGMHGSKATCFSCRARHKHNLIPNFVADAIASTYFDERHKDATEPERRCATEDRACWEKRRATGRAAVQELTENLNRKKKAAHVVSPEPFYVASEVVIVSPYQRRTRGR